MTSLRRFGDPGYPALVKDLSGLLEAARHSYARAVNAIMTATYWEIGRRMVEFEQRGEKRAEYGVELLETLAADLTRRFGRGFSRQNLQYMRQFYTAFPPDKIRRTVSGNSALNIRQTSSSKSATLSRIFTVDTLAETFPLPWSHYILLIHARVDGRDADEEGVTRGELEPWRQSALHHVTCLGGCGWSGPIRSGSLSAWH